MVAKTNKWEQVKLLFEAGKSLNEIELETGFNKGSISRQAKKDGWKKGKLQPFILDAVRAKEELATPELHLVAVESDRILGLKKKRDSIADKAFERIEKELKDCEVQHIKSLIEAADKTCVMAEIAPRFNPNSTTINNVNAQQNNGGEKPSILVSFVDNDKDVIDGETGKLSEQVSEYIPATPL